MDSLSTFVQYFTMDTRVYGLCIKCNFPAIKSLGFQCRSEIENVRIFCHGFHTGNKFTQSLNLEKNELVIIPSLTGETIIYAAIKFRNNISFTILNGHKRTVYCKTYQNESNF